MNNLRSILNIEFLVKDFYQYTVNRYPVPRTLCEQYSRKFPLVDNLCKID